MKVLSRFRKAVVAWAAKQVTLSGVDTGRGWFSIFRSGDTATGSWQQDEEFNNDTILKNTVVWSSVTQISGDCGKLAIRLMTLEDGVWVETTNPAYSPVLRRPNHYQTRQQMIEQWLLSKLIHGNAYILKGRDNRNVVTSLYVLDPARVTPLVAEDGSVFYQLQRDDLSKLPGTYPAVPASEIMHDRMNCLFHPLVGISPLYSADLPASQGLRIQKNSERFFKNMSRPGGMLTAPGEIKDETAKRLKSEFEANFSGDKLGRLFVGGDGLEFNSMALPAEASQLVEQLKLSGEQIAGAFGVPGFLVGAGPVPSYDNVQSLMQLYHSQCLQKLLNAIEDVMDIGLGLMDKGYRLEFDLDDLLRMDSAKQAEVIEKLGKAAVLSPNEGRRKLGYKPVAGGNSPMAQQQNYSLEALAKRDAQQDPFGTAKPPAPAGMAPHGDSEDADTQMDDAADEAKAFLPPLTRSLQTHGATAL